MERNKFFTHRFLPIFSVFLFTVFVFFTNVKAVSDTDKSVVTPEGDIYILPNDCTDNFFITENINNTIYLIYGNYPDWQFSENNGDVCVNNIGNGSTQTFMCYVIPKGNFDFRNYTNKFSTTWTTINPQKNVSYAGCKILYSSNDLYLPTGEIFFQKPLVPVLVEIMEKEQAEKKTIQEILEILPLILVVVVSFLGLRKALNWLLTLLRHS